VLLALLIVVGLAGLRGQISGLGWNGPLHREAVPVGIGLEVVLAVLLAITIHRLAGRRHARPAGAVAVTLRWALVVVLSAGMVAVAATMLIGLHQHSFSGSGRTRPEPAVRVLSRPQASRPGRHFFFTVHIHLPVVLLYALVVLLFLGAIALRMWWVRHFRRSGPVRRPRSVAEVSHELLEAVESGRSALRAIDEARAAIIACYLAMEASLAERGTARAAADTPNELLARATATGIVRGTAGARLTALFYEARFSTHPLDRGQRDAAEQALGELAAALAEVESAGRLSGRSRPARSGGTHSRPRGGGGLRGWARSGART
jgi:hypothetical protein